MKILIYLTVFHCWIQVISTRKCYWNSECKYKYFGSKTPYETVRGDIRDSILITEGCEPISIWALMRHGGRYPGGNYAKAMKDALVIRDYLQSSYNGNISLCAQDIQNLWIWEFDENFFGKPYALTKEGYLEMFGIGRRLKEAAPGLLNDLKVGEYVIRPAFATRTLDSIQGFMDGLQGPEFIMEKDENDYDIISPYSTCGKYQRDVKNNPDTYKEAYAYENNTEFLKAKERIEMRLGLNSISNTEITALYDLCRYTWNGIDDKPSPWCAFFSEEDLRLMEYIDDLRHYYRNGYGTPMSEVFGQIPLSDLFFKLQDAKEGNGKKIVSYVSHSTMMDMILSALGLFKDENPLTAAYRDVHRKWRTTTISTFGVNLIAILYKCQQNEHKVAFYWNEEPLTSMCHEGVCSWQQFEDRLTPFLNTTLDFCEFRSPPY